METLPERCEYIRKFRYFLDNHELVSRETSAELWMLTVKCAKNELEKRKYEKKA